MRTSMSFADLLLRDFLRRPEFETYLVTSIAMPLLKSRAVCRNLFGPHVASARP
jgi:hypothetical protein